MRNNPINLKDPEGLLIPPIPIIICPDVALLPIAIPETQEDKDSKCKNGFCVVGSGLIGNDITAKVLRWLGTTHVDIYYKGVCVYVGKGGADVRKDCTLRDDQLKVESYWPLKKSKKGRLKYGQKAGKECKCITDKDILDCLRNKPKIKKGTCQKDVREAVKSCCLEGFWTIVSVLF